MKAGKVFMMGPSGKPGWVDSKNVREYLKRPGYSVVPRVKMRVDAPGGPIVREFAGSRVPFNWQENGEVVDGSDTSTGTTPAEGFSNIARGSVAGAVRAAGQMAPLMVPGVGAGPAVLRAMYAFGGGTGGDVAARAIEGSPQDLGGSASVGGMSALWGLPFEGASAMLPKHAPGMMAGVLRPTKTQQVAAENVAARQGGVAPQADYERLASQALGEGVRPQRGGEGAAELRRRMDSDNLSVEDMIDEAGQMGIRITAPQLVRSAEVRDVMTKMRMEGAPKEDLAYARGWLSEFQRHRSVPGVKSKPTGVLNSRGEMGMTKKQPATPNQMTPTKLNTEKRVWREESKPVLSARAKGNPVGPQQGIAARLSDAMSRAAKSRLDALPVSRPDPMGTGKAMGVRNLNERIERRIPLEDALQEYSRRVPQTKMETVARLFQGHLLPRGAESWMAQFLHDPRFTQMRAFGPTTAAMASQASSGRKSE
jgi:hypothetical protein